MEHTKSTKAESIRQANREQTARLTPSTVLFAQLGSLDSQARPADRALRATIRAELSKRAAQGLISELLIVKFGLGESK